MSYEKEFIKFLSSGDLNVPEPMKKSIREYFAGIGIYLTSDSPMIMENHMWFKYQGSEEKYYSQRNYKHLFETIIKYK